MKKNFRQLLALFLCLVFVFSVLPTVAMAEGETVSEETQTEEDLLLNDDGDQIDKEKQTDGEDLIDGEKQTNGENLIDSEKQTDSEDLIDGEKQTDGEDLIDGEKQTDGENLIDGEKQTDGVGLGGSEGLTDEEGQTRVVPTNGGWYLEFTEGDITYQIELVIQLEGSYYPSSVLADFTYSANDEELRLPFFLKVVTGTDFNDPEKAVTLAGDIQNRIKVPHVSLVGQYEDGSALSDDTFSWDDNTCEGSLILRPNQDFSGTMTAGFTFDEIQYSICQSVSYHMGSGNQGGDPGPGVVSEQPSVMVQDGDTSYEVVFFMQEPYGPESLIPIRGGCGEGYTSNSNTDFERSFILGIVSPDDQNTLDPDTDLQGRLHVQSITFSGVNMTPSQGQNWTLDWTSGSRACTVSATPQAGFDGLLIAEFEFNNILYTVRTNVHYEPQGSGGNDGLSEQPSVMVQDGDTSYEVVFFMQEPNGPEPLIPIRGGCGENYTSDSDTDFERSFILGIVSPDDQNTLDPDTDLQGRLHVQSITFSGVNMTPSQGQNWTLDWTSGSRACTVSATPQAGFDGLLIAEFEFNNILYTVRTNVHYRPQGSDGPGGDDEVLDWHTFVQDGDISYEILFVRSQGEPVSGIGKSYYPIDTDAFQESIQLSIVTGDHPDDMNPRTVVTDETVTEKFSILDIRFRGSNEIDEPGESNWSINWSDSGVVNISAPCKAGFSGELTARFEFDGEPFSIQIPVYYREISTFLSFTPTGSDQKQFFIILDELSTISGILKLHVWDDNLLDYTETHLTSEQYQTYISLQVDDPSMQTVELSWDEQNSLLTVSTGDCTGGFTISYYDENTGINLSIDGFVCNPNSEAWDQTIIDLLFGDEIVTVGAGFLENGSLSVGGNTGGIFEPDFEMPFYRQFVLGGIIHQNDQALEFHAPAAFFDRIETCDFHLVSYTGTKPTIEMYDKQPYSDLDGAELFSFDLRSSVPNEPFTAELAVTFTYKENDWHDGEPLSNYIVRFEAFYKESPNKTVAANDLNSTEALNHVLASKEALAEYLENAGVDFAWDGVVSLFLPAVEYEGKIVCSILNGGDEFVGVELCGSPRPDAPKPIIHALEDRGGLWTVNNICFVKNDVTQTYGGNEFTCGLLVNCSGQTLESSIGGIFGCTFSDFDYAIRGTDTGYPGSIRNCEFIGSGCGLYIDCQGLNAAINVEVEKNTFSGCQNAICIPNLPVSITSYVYRIHDNVFLGEGQTDINITQPGTFFCYGNYFGIDENTRRSAILFEGPNTRIIVNPCRERPDSNTYWIDPTLPTDILRSEASSFAIDRAAFGSNQSVTINVVDVGDSGISTVGTWTFGGTGA